MKKKLVLENGEVLFGETFGSTHDISGEVVFYTGMSGYQEVMTNPSNFGQIVCMTYPLVGNYGVNRDDYESLHVSIEGMIVKEVCEHPSNFRSQMGLADFFEKKKLSGLQGVDTRKLARILRDNGTLRGKVVDAGADVQAVVEGLKNTPAKQNYVEQASTKSSYANPTRGLRVVLIDLGAKLGIIRELSARNCDVTVVPHSSTPEEILALRPDGILISNGPGIPEEQVNEIETIKNLLGKVPVFGINLGHQILALACGAKLKKLKYAVSGGAPVFDLEKNKVNIVSENHAYVVDNTSLEGTGLKESHQSVNYKTNEGLKHEKYRAFSVQFQPEAAPGSEDALYIFDEFIDLMKKAKGAKKETATA